MKISKPAEYGKPANIQYNGSSTLDKLMELSEKLEREVDLLAEFAEQAAVAKDFLARAKSEAVKRHKDSGKSQELRDAFADSEFADARLVSLKADNRKEAQLEKVKSLRQILSALQTFVNSEKAVAEMLGYGQSKQR